MTKLTRAAQTKIDIYPRSRSPKLDSELFCNPSAEYRGTPFWAWNNRLDRQQLFRQVDCFKKMGLGGYHIHSRTGMGTEYLGDEFMKIVREVVDYGKSKDMLSWLYDEDRWPSGAAGGIVTRDHAFRSRHLIFTARPYGWPRTEDEDWIVKHFRRDNGTLLGRWEVSLRDGYLASYRRLADGQTARDGARVWYAYLEVARDSPWYNNEAYVDTLNRKAIERFIEVTHERYADVVGDEFGKSIPAMFTDEPQFMHKQFLKRADEIRDVIIPFTGDFFETYAAAYGQRLEDALPEIFWDLPDGKASLARYRYHDHLAERFAHAFADTIGDWCAEHGIALTGHMMEEPTLQSQTAALGEAMRSYRSFQLPGIDMLCDWHEYTTAKQAQSASRQFGRSGVLSELYGVTNWDFDFVGHKAQGDWQAALGVTVRVPHLSWVSMAGEAKRDYPASISYQSPWFEQYKLIEDHFARINTVLTRGKASVRVGVVHPVESYWLCFGPLETSKLEREERETAFANITNWLIFALVDFDFLCESLLPVQCENDGLKSMGYELVIVPSLHTIRSTTLDRLEAFAKAGGQVVFAGDVPTLVDAVPSDRAKKLAERCSTIAFTRPAVVETVAEHRDVEVRLADGGLADTLLYQMRVDGDSRHVFFCNVDRLLPRENVSIRFKGDWRVTLLDTETGGRSELASRRQGGWTILDHTFAAHGHALFTLEPGWRDGRKSLVPAKLVERGRLSDPVPVTLSEPNVLLLDQAQWRLDDGPWQATEEVLRVDNLAREKWKLPPKTGEIAQPWVDTEVAPVAGQLGLKFTIECEVDVPASTLALEDAVEIRIELDGRRIASEVSGWWTDEAIHTVKLPAMTKGRHEIVLTLPFSRKRNVEWCYLLGDFGVRVAGRHATITAPVRSLSFGDWCTQGLPFYAGNVTYHCKLEGDGRETTLAVPKFKAPLLSVDLDGKSLGPIAFAPFDIELGKLSSGSHSLDLTAYGNRVNAFGCVHNTNPQLRWYGPDCWRTQGTHWAYEYQLRPMGILTAPIVKGAV